MPSTRCCSLGERVGCLCLYAAMVEEDAPSGARVLLFDDLESSYAITRNPSTALGSLAKQSDIFSGKSHDIGRGMQD